MLHQGRINAMGIVLPMLPHAGRSDLHLSRRSERAQTSQKQNPTISERPRSGVQVQFIEPDMGVQREPTYLQISQRGMFQCVL